MVGQPAHPGATSVAEVNALGERLMLRGPVALPGWRLVQRGEDGELWRHRSGQSAVWSVSTEADGRDWLHISTGFPDRLPKWTDLVAVKEWFAGTDSYGYQVAPPRKFYVNIHPNVLHLFVPLFDPPPLPEFSGKDSTGRTTI